MVAFFQMLSKLRIVAEEFLTQFPYWRLTGKQDAFSRIIEHVLATDNTHGLSISNVLKNKYLLEITT